MSDYDNYLLRPIPSLQDTRESVTLRTHLGKGIWLNTPIIGSPMKGIMSVELAKALSIYGGIGILHRFYDTIFEWIDDIEELGGYKFGISIPLDGNDGYPEVYVLDAGTSIICIDVANGYIDSLLKRCLEIANRIAVGNYNTLLMAGNVVTWDGVRALQDSGVDLVRFGIGTGHLCTTRKVTGVGRDQIAGLYETRTHKPQAKIIADGGIQTSGDAVKALAFGADAVMLGSLLGKTHESAHNGIIYGMASRKLQEEYYHSVKSVEGIEEEMKKEVSLKDFLTEFCYGIKSACTYLDVDCIKLLQKEGMKQFKRYYYDGKK